MKTSLRNSKQGLFIANSLPAYTKPQNTWDKPWRAWKPHFKSQVKNASMRTDWADCHKEFQSCATDHSKGGGGVCEEQWCEDKH